MMSDHSEMRIEIARVNRLERFADFAMQHATASSRQVRVKRLATRRDEAVAADHAGDDHHRCRLGRFADTLHHLVTGFCVA